MISIKTARKIALSLEGSSEEPHFERPSFRVKKKIFATLDAKKAEMVLKLTDIEQDIFIKVKSDAFYPVPGAWGKKGWTVMRLSQVNAKLCKHALDTAYRIVAPK